MVVKEPCRTSLLWDLTAIQAATSRLVWYVWCGDSLRHSLLSLFYDHGPAKINSNVDPCLCLLQLLHSRGRGRDV